MFIVKMADHDGNRRCLIEKNVSIVLILPSRWQDGGESIWMERTSCLWPKYGICVGRNTVENKHLLE